MMIQFTQGYKTDKVNSSLVRDFIGGLLKYTPDTLGIFVAPSGYTQSSLELAESADYNILLLNTSNLIKKFILYVNKRVKKRSSDVCDTITIKNAEVDNIKVEEGFTLSLFGIEVKGKVSLSNINLKT
ncbi:unnamed protein product [Rhizophagus irregularis]|nr:unnamed protein product [Rhizophagus irregularis]CAB4442817.1 unnamed protein product [Rhizophagus irregularis]